MRAAAPLFLAATLCCAAAGAQSQAPKPAATPTPAPVEEPAPPYEAQLLRLSELMGALAYLRELCAPGEGETFRAKMAGLLDAEAKTPPRKELLAGAYNRGFQDYELSYAACTPSARAVVARFLDETGRLAKDVSDRFGG